MARLNTKRRNALPNSDFAGPGRSYPDEDRAHGRDAKARASEFASPAVKAEVDRNVDRKYPSMGKGESRGRVPRGEHHAAGHREPRNHAEFERLGNSEK